MKLSELIGYLNKIQDRCGDLDVNLYTVFKNYPINKPLEKVFVTGKLDVKENKLGIKHGYVVLS